MTTAKTLGTILLVAALPLGGCTTLRAHEARSTEQLLAAAGFRAAPAETPEQLASLRSMPSRVLLTQPKDGHFVYSYADPDNCGCIYEGGPEEYAAYQRLSLEKRLEDERTTEIERRTRRLLADHCPLRCARAHT
jgi:hypothetical protein